MNRYLAPVNGTRRIRIDGRPVVGETVTVLTEKGVPKFETVSRVVHEVEGGAICEIRSKAASLPPRSSKWEYSSVFGKKKRDFW